MRLSFLSSLQREEECLGGSIDWYKQYKDALTKIKQKDKEIAELTDTLRRLQSSGTSTSGYPYTIKWCPGYEGHVPPNSTHEVCKHCGSIEYYH